MDRAERRAIPDRADHGRGRRAGRRCRKCLRGPARALRQHRPPAHFRRGPDRRWDVPGSFFAYEIPACRSRHHDVAKGIGGGFPLGACLATRDAAKGMTVGTHGTTYGGNPLAMACGNAVLDVVLAPGFLDDVARTGTAPETAPRRAPGPHPGDHRRDPRRGLDARSAPRDSNTDSPRPPRAAEVIVIPAGDKCVRLLPPLIRRRRLASRRRRAARNRLHALRKGLLRRRTGHERELPRPLSARHFLDLCEFRRDGIERRLDRVRHDEGARVKRRAAAENDRSPAKCWR